MITGRQQQGDLGFAPIVAEIIVAAVPALISLAASQMGGGGPPPPPPCTFWQRLSQLFGGHPACRN